LLEQVDSVKQKARREKLKANIDQARLSRVLVDLVRKVPMEMMTFPQGMDKAGDLRMEGIDGDRLLKFYDQMGFKDLKRRVEGRLTQGGPAPDATPRGAAPEPTSRGPVSKPPYRGPAPEPASRAPAPKSATRAPAPKSPSRSSYGRPKADVPKPEDYADVPF
jgi:DNA polymerase-1